MVTAIAAITLIGSQIVSLTGPYESPELGTKRDLLTKFQFSQVHMGVRVNIALFAPTHAVAETAAKAGFTRFAELEAIMSDYRPDSELMKLCARAGQGAQPVSRDLWVVLGRAQEVAERSGGAFDITCGPLIQIWREARKTKKLPTFEAIETARLRVGWQKLRLPEPSPNGTVAELTIPNMRLDLGGIAKGYACDEAIEALSANGIERAMVEAGGDISVSGAPPGKIGWQVVIASPSGTPSSTELYLKHQALSTSGDMFQFVTIGGRRCSHIVDPRTGWPLTHGVQVSVLARNGLTTDGLATALCVLPQAEGIRLASRYDATAIYFRRR